MLISTYWPIFFNYADFEKSAKCRVYHKCISLVADNECNELGV